MIHASHTFTTNVDKKQEHHKIRIKGHADYDEHGKDIVCSAVSILVKSFTDTIMSAIDEDVSKIAPGSVYLEYECASYDDYIHAATDMFMLGLEWLEDEYPDHVEVTEEEVV